LIKKGTEVVQEVGRGVPTLEGKQFIVVP